MRAIADAVVGSLLSINYDGYNSYSVQRGGSVIQEAAGTGPGPINPSRSSVIQRSKMFLEVASELVGSVG